VLSAAKTHAKMTVWSKNAIRVKKPRHEAPKAAETKRNALARDTEKQKAVTRERERIAQENARRYDSGEAPMSITSSEKRAREAGVQAGLRLTNLNKRIRAQREAAGSNVGELKAVRIESSACQRGARLSGIGRDES
jgi:hypothetical protein